MGLPRAHKRPLLVPHFLFAFGNVPACCSSSIFTVIGTKNATKDGFCLFKSDECLTEVLSLQADNRNAVDCCCHVPLACHIPMAGDQRTLLVLQGLL